MANKVCISLEMNEKLQKAVADGEFSLAKIQKTENSSERFELVNKYLADEELSTKVVREIEKRIGSKKETIVEDYIARTFTSVPENTRKGVLNKFKRMSTVLGEKDSKKFLEELVAYKFGAYITKEEANKFEELTNDAILLREKVFENEDFKNVLTLDKSQVDELAQSPDLLAYGNKIVELENAEADVLLKRAGFQFSDYKKIDGQRGKERIAGWSKYLGRAALEGSGAARAFQATADVSGLLRQSWKIFSSGVFEAGFNLATGKKGSVKFNIWRNQVHNTIKAIQQTGEFGDYRFYNQIRAEVHAHPYSILGVYDAGKGEYGLRTKAEEQFPSSAPTELYDKYVKYKKANIFKMSEVAFNASILKARHELANHTINILKESGANVMDKNIADEASAFVSAFTGRGGLGKAEGFAEDLNKVFFAPKFAASQFSPYFQIFKGVTYKADNAASKLAMEQNLQFIIGSASLMLLAETLRAGVMGEDADYTSVLNPMSNTFGKVEIFGSERMLDFTGGNRSVWGLMTGLFAEKYYDSRLNIWRKKSFFQTADGKAYYDFASSKYAPVPSTISSLLKGKQFGGAELPSIFTGETDLNKNLVTAKTVVTNLLMPITVKNVAGEELMDKKSDMSTALLVLAGETVGLSTSDIRFKPQNDEWSALLNTDKKAYWQAVDELWTNIQEKVKVYRIDDNFQNLTEKEQTEKLEKMYSRELDKVIKQEKYRTVSKEKLEEIKAEKDK